ncbi:protein CPR-5 isoform X1 [Amborella trichopoda]|uniref:Protein CPR-5 n=1 Tax=Amborella trichopoda TaxID=13333 RepID=W1PKV7_AMBTC|nr:protein CPR-5 isoform X1 [Amborella trichopoda]ERN08296.1 hypothetical protein AMTR_s00156p00040920 [Amborella trichopoda]|eukprot:XP_006846621.1 protein CPR-5 isoform X1 [Amborella trichopoda]
MQSLSHGFTACTNKSSRQGKESLRIDKEVGYAKDGDFLSLTNSPTPSSSSICTVADDYIEVCLQGFGNRGSKDMGECSSGILGEVRDKSGVKTDRFLSFETALKESDGRDNGVNQVGFSCSEISEFCDVPDRSKSSKRRTRKTSRKAQTSLRRSIQIMNKRANLRIWSDKAVERCSSSSGDDQVLEALGYPLGMSIAAVFSKALDTPREKMPADHISKLCSNAMKESFLHFFGDRFNAFVGNFEKSFGSTLKTLQLVDRASTDEKTTVPCLSEVKVNPSIPLPSANICDSGGGVEESDENIAETSISQQVVLHGHVNQQLVQVAQSIDDIRFRQSVMGTFEKSVIEQARSNDLKTCEIGLIIRRMRLKEAQLALDSDSNSLQRVKLSMDVSKASFKEEKLKDQMKDSGHAELIKMCNDCLVAGMLIMSASLGYAVYTYSYDRITEATMSCTPSSKGSSKSWFRNPMDLMIPQLQYVRCQFIVMSRLLFCMFMVLAIAYLLLQRSGSSRQTMPLTFILILLGVFCGFAGKLCVDGLGGSGYWWLAYWEVLCALHLFANCFTPALYFILNGPIAISFRKKEKVRIPYWIRVFVFYSCILVIHPVLCGLVPFASLHDWKDHFSTLWAHHLY